MKKYFVNVPFAYLTCEEPKNVVCEVSDELLYGFEVEGADTMDSNYMYVTTDYGYGGFINSLFLSEQCFDNRVIVSSDCADLLITPEYKYPPIMTLSRGSIVSIAGEYEKFYSVNTYDGNILYIRKENVIKSTYKYSAQTVIKIAQSYIGTPYRWGGKSTFGIDCSGLCHMAYRMCGINVSRDSSPDKRFVSIVDKEKIQAGDILHFKNHVALYLGDGNFIHSNSKDGFVTQSRLHERAELVLKFASRPKM